MLYAAPHPYSVLERGLDRLVPRRTVRTVLVDGGDGVAEKAAARMAAVGYTDVAVLAGGMPAWADAGYVVFQGVNVPSKAFGEVVEVTIRGSELKGKLRSGTAFKAVGSDQHEFVQGLLTEHKVQYKFEPEAEQSVWVMVAIKTGLVDVKMCQSTGKLTVYSATQRNFQPAQWKDMKKKVHH